ncbi:MAG: aromatic amino acid ammonia-lyase [Bacteroidota bacterium]
MITIGSNNATLDDIFQILFEDEMVELQSSSTQRVKYSYEFLKSFCKDKLIYGINTGLGPMAQYKIEDSQLKQLQYNAIRSHCSGCGEPLTPIYAKAAVLSRLSNMIKGYSGVHPEVVELLKELVNQEVLPIIPEHGGVGASGDLVQLAHLALTLIGEGKVIYQNEIQSTADVFKELGLKPIDVHIREGLSLINGTSVMTGISLVNLIKAKNLLDWSVVASSMLNEIVESFDDHFSYELNKVKYHKGQENIAGFMRTILSDSQLIRKRHEHLFDKKVEDKILTDKVQEYYSLRCVPQILGPVIDTLAYAEEVIINEFNSVNDNPIIDFENNNVFHGGNFHGDYISLENDKMKTAITKLSMLMERQLNYMLNSKLNDILPPFVNLGVLGLNFGMQGVQFTATSTVAENQTLSFPMYVHSISCNNDNQDIVSMGTNSALLTRKVISNTFDVIAIEMITIIQAIDYLGIQSKLSAYTSHIYHQLREVVPVFKEDTTKSDDIKSIRVYIETHRLDLDKSLV